LILRTATWNCQHGKPDPGGLGTAVATLDVDVLALQEVDRGSRRAGGLDLAAEATAAFGGGAGELVWAPALTLNGGGTYGNALLVRGEVLRSVTLPLPGRRRQEPRVAALAEVVSAGRPWTIAATHLTTRRDLSPGQLLTVLDALRSWPAPRLLLGDLNLEVADVLPWMTAESYRLAVGPLTHSVRRPRRQIDHVAVNGRDCAVGVRGARALPVGDHLALFADVSCPDPPGSVLG
jgi:endonuclease/exonuclease/phosphatase family metal-dependent hydrolase